MESYPKLCGLDNVKANIEANDRVVAGIRKWHADFMADPSGNRMTLMVTLFYAATRVSRGELGNLADADPAEYAVSKIPQRRKIGLVAGGVVCVLLGIAEASYVIAQGWAALSTFGIGLTALGFYLFSAAGYNLSTLKENLELGRSQISTAPKD